MYNILYNLLIVRGEEQIVDIQKKALKLIDLKMKASVWDVSFCIFVARSRPSLQST